MSEANKAVARKFLKALGADDVITLRTLMTADMVSTVPGNSKVAGARDLNVFLAVAAAFPKITRAGIDLRILNLTAEEDRVACEAEGFSVMKNGEEYNNHYHFLMFFRDGKICRMMEYCDTKLAEDVILPYLSGSAT